MKRISLYLLLYTGIGCGNPGETDQAASTNYESLLLDYAESEKLNIRLPYIYGYSNKNKSVLVYGSYHTSNFRDTMIYDIESKLINHQPDLIMYEGDGIGIEASKEESVLNYFEMGLVRYLARERNIPDLNLEPLASERNKYLLEKYTRDEVLLASIGSQIILLMVANKGNEFEEYYPLFVDDLEREGIPFSAEERTLDYFYKAYQDFYGVEFDINTFDYETVEIKFNKTKLNEINQESAHFRDTYMIGLIQESLKEYDRIYIQIGGRHAIVWEPAIHKMLEDIGNE